MAGKAIARVVFVISAAALVAGCQGEGSPFAKREGAAATRPAADQTAVAGAAAAYSR